MHIAALNPKSISEKDLDKEIIDSETEIIKRHLKDSVSLKILKKC